MYLQAARYILKSYGGHMLKGKPLTDCVSYIAKFGEVAEINFAGKQPWTLPDLRNLLLKSINYIIGVITARLGDKLPGEK